MSKALLVKDPSEFLKNLKKPLRLSQKTSEGPQSKPNRSIEGAKSCKKDLIQRNSNPYYFSSNSPTPVGSAQSAIQVSSKVQLLKAKTMQITDLINVTNTLSALDSEKKVSTSTSIIETDFPDEKNTQILNQMVASMNANFVNIHKIDVIESMKLKNNPKLHLTQTFDALTARNSSNQGNISAQMPTSSKTVPKSRKSVASDVRERSSNDITQTSGQRSVSKAPLFSQKRIISPLGGDSKTFKPLNRSPPPQLDDNDIIPEYSSKEKKIAPMKTAKPMHPLKEIRIDIANFADDNLESDINKFSTSRTKNKISLLNPRAELATANEKVNRSRLGAAQTPQSGIYGVASKANFGIGTPKRDIEPKESGKNQLIKAQLTEDEIKQYGDRFPEGYEKKDFLGRGGFALVWLGLDRSTGKKVAVKQMLKTNSGEAQKREVFFGQMLFHKGGEPRDLFRRYPGINNIASFIEHKSSRLDEWMIGELGGDTLSKLLFEIRGEFLKGERVYRVKDGILGQAFKAEKSALPTFIKQMAQILLLLSDCKTVHSDLKPDNILINGKSLNSGKPFDLKLIDFGSAYCWNDAGNIGMATPEYMPPECLDILFGNKGTKSTLEQLMDKTKPWSIDVWSLGSIILEIITGVPLWMSLKCRIDIGNKSVTRTGIFAAKGRAYDKIYIKQLSVVEKLSDALDEYMKYWNNSKELFDLVSQMMTLDPMKRISPSDILSHTYLQEAL